MIIKRNFFVGFSNTYDNAPLNNKFFPRIDLNKIKIVRSNENFEREEEQDSINNK